MTENISLRIRCGSLFIVVTPTSGTEFQIDVTDALGRPPEEELQRRDALRFLLKQLSGLRSQVWKMLGEEILT